MRLRARPSVLLAVLAMLVLPVAAAADPKPIPKPPSPPPAPPVTHTVTPTKQPVTSTPTNTPTKTSTPTGTGTSSTGSTTTSTTGTRTKPAGTGSHTQMPVETVVVPVTADGGRDQSLVTLPLPPPPEPTPLALVGASETVPSKGSGTPVWKLALLALLAAGEAFVVVRLVRRRPATLSPAQ